MRAATAAAAAAMARMFNAQDELFLRRASLTKEERRVNYKQIDRDAIEVVTSRAATRQTPLMSKIYLRLLNANPEFLERDGVLRFTGCEIEGRWLTAWEQLLMLLQVASATAIKALTWMHAQGVIGYDAHKNGVGIRIFLNRAKSSIAPAHNLAAVPAQKNLDAARTSSQTSRTSTFDAPSNAVLDMLESDLIPHAPKNGAKETTPEAPATKPIRPLPVPEAKAVNRTAEPCERFQPDFSVDEIVRRLKIELEPCVRAATVNAVAREHSQTREWFETKALPKAVRVAQKESYTLLRKLGGQDWQVAKSSHASSQVGKYEPANAPAKPLRPRTPQEIHEVAEMCLALYEVQGKSVEVTLAEISSENGGWLPTEDKAKVRQAIDGLFTAHGGQQSVE